MTALLDPSLAELDFDPEILCVFQRFCNPCDHPATWWVTLSCGCPYPICQRALRFANLRLRARPLTCRLCNCDRISIRSVVRI
ncbi:MAG: hypothetical protein JST91_17355 [Actinobacteria bacterium]|nr:hypothetical protein [Actinomycetota bacterium]